MKEAGLIKVSFWRRYMSEPTLLTQEDTKFTGEKEDN